MGGERCANRFVTCETQRARWSSGVLVGMMEGKSDEPCPVASAVASSKGSGKTGDVKQMAEGGLAFLLAFKLAA